MHSSTGTVWDRDRFGQTLKEIGERAHLTPGDIARLAGRSRSQVSRWTRSENQPGYAALRSLAENLVASHPGLAPLAAELLNAAGYGADFIPADAGQVEDDAEDEELMRLQSELRETLARMSRRDKQRWMAEMRQEEIERLERWRRLMNNADS